MYGALLEDLTDRLEEVRQAGTFKNELVMSGYPAVPVARCATSRVLARSGAETTQRIARV
jgi:hypothetical protein